MNAAMVLMVILTFVPPGQGSGLAQTATVVSAATCQQAQRSAAKSFEIKYFGGESSVSVKRRIDCIPIVPTTK